MPGIATIARRSARENEVRAPKNEMGRDSKNLQRKHKRSV